MAVFHAPSNEAETSRRDVGIVLVGAVDRRLLPALAVAATLRDVDLKAVHVATDDADGRRVAESWMRLDLSWVPLEIVDAGRRSLVATVDEVVRRESEDRGRGRVVVIVPELDLPRRWQALLHRGTARRIARRLQPLPGVSTVVVPYAAPAR
jgi:hypothetical protein